MLVIRNLCRYSYKANNIDKLMTFKTVVHSLSINNDMKVNRYYLVRLYSNSSLCLFAKAKKNNNKIETNESDNTSSLPDSINIKQQMENIIDKFTKELNSLKIGRVSSDTFNDIHLGSLGPISSVGQVSLKSSSNITISVYDPSLTKIVSDAIKDCGLGLTPNIEGSIVSVFIPKASKESRDFLVKSASRIGEKAKQDIRSIRKESLDLIKKCKGQVSDDDSKRASKDIENMTEKHVEKVSQSLNAKEKELLS